MCVGNLWVSCVWSGAGEVFCGMSEDSVYSASLRLFDRLAAGSKRRAERTDRSRCCYRVHIVHLAESD